MKNFVQEGCNVDIALPYVRTAGQGVLLGTLFGVCIVDGASGATVTIATEGVYDLTATGTASAGDAAYWDNTNKRITATSTDNTKVGTFLAAKASGDATARVRLFC